MDVDDTGLSIDMLDADRLREWARLLLLHGPDIGHWGSVTHVAGKMQMLATGIEKAVRDIGALRADLAATRMALEQAEELTRTIAKAANEWRESSKRNLERYSAERASHAQTKAALEQAERDNRSLLAELAILRPQLDEARAAAARINGDNLPTLTKGRWEVEVDVHGRVTVLGYLGDSGRR